MKKRILQMKWTKRIVLIVLLLGVAGLGKMYAYDFSAVCETGQTLYYNITDAENHYVALVCPGPASFFDCWSGFTEPIGAIVLPENVQYEGNTYAVTSIGDYAFCNCSNLTGSLTIPNSVVTIGDAAFSNCYGFTGSLTIGDSVTTIVDGAFYYCFGFTGSLTIPNSVTEIGGSAFSWCSGFTGSLTIPNSVTTIGDSAFSDCSGFTGSLTIPNSVTTIGEGAFSNCSGFTGSLTIPNSVTTIGDWAFSGCSGFTGSLTIPNSVTTIGQNAFSYCSGFTGSLTIPNSVTTISNYAFYGCSGFTGSLTIPNSVTTIGGSAFYNCSGFTGSLTIPNSVTTIGNYAFSGCSGFTGSLTIPNSVTTIGGSAFYNCSGFTGSLTIPNSVASIGNRAFQNCNGFNSITNFAETPPILGEGSFAGWNLNTPVFVPCGFEEVYSSLSWGGFRSYYEMCGGTVTVVANPVEGGMVTGGGTFETGQICTVMATEYEGYFFSYWELDGSRISSNSDFSFYVAGDMTLVAHFVPDANIVFADTNVKSICVANWDTNSDGELSYIEAAAVADLGQVFRGNTTITSFEELQYFTGLTTISNYAFYNCGNLSGSLYIPNSVTTIGRYAFSGCSSLTGSLTIPNSVTTIGGSAFYGCSGFTGSLSIGNFVTTIGDSAFEGCSGFIGSLTIPNSVTSIGNSAFRGCSGLTGSLTISNSVTTISNYAFYGCSGLTGSLTIGNSVTTIGRYAFSGCSGLEAVYYEGNINQWCTIQFGDYYSNPLVYAHNLFIDNELVTDLMIPETVTEINPYTFCGATCITSLSIPNTVTRIGWYAFNNCRGLTGSLTIPNSVTTIGDYAFYYCNGFTGSLTIPNSVTTIGQNAFSYCSGFTGSLTIPNSVTTIGNSAFRGCSGFTGSLTLPNSVTSIGVEAFYYCSGFTGNLIIPNSVTWIGNRAFDGCNGFYSVTSLAETPPSLGYYAFSSYYSDKPVYVPCGYEEAYASVSWGGFNDFIGFCGGMVTVLADPEESGVVIGGGHIEANQFCTVTATANEGYVFANWTINGLVVSAEAEYTFYVAGDMTLVAHFVQNGNINFIDANVKAICVANWDSNGDGELSYAEAAAVIDLGQVFSENTEITSFEELQYFIGLTSISSSAFYGCSNLSGSLYIPNSVTSIGNNAFNGCSGLTGSLTIPNSVTTIGNQAFYGCNGFTGSLTIPNSVTTIGNQAFYYCNGFTGSLTIGNSVTSIGNYAFQGCSGFTEVHYDASNCADVSNSAQSFYGCGGTLTIGDNVERIPANMFRNCRGFTGGLTIPNSVTTIGQYAFYNCSGFTGSLTIGNSVTSIGNYAFNGCSGFTGSLTIPNSVTTIGNNAFYNCSGFTGSLTIGNSVTMIDYSAFYGCNGFSSVSSLAETPPSLGYNAFSSYYSDKPVYVPCGYEEAYASVSWGGFNDFIGFCGGIVTVMADPEESGMVIGGGQIEANQLCTVTATANEGYAFGNWTFNGTVVSVEAEYAFYVAGDMTLVAHFVQDGNIVFADANVKTICISHWDTNGDGELSYAEAASVTSLNNYFQSNAQITSFEELQYFIGLSSIGNYEFYNCYNLSGDLIIPNSVTTIGYYAFYGCNGFRGNLIIGNSVTTIGDSAFSSCRFSSITSLAETPPTLMGYRPFGYYSFFLSVYVPCGFEDVYASQSWGDFSDFVGLCGGMVTVLANPEEGGMVTGGGMCEANQICIVTATASEGYIFYNWTQNGRIVSTNNDYSFYVSDDVTLVAHFVPEGNIVFADPNVKAICVANWDTDGDGELSYVEAANVSALDNYFQGNTSITSFDELQYFIGLSSIGFRSFENCNGLTSIVLPSSVTLINSYAFSGCSALTGNLTIPNSVTSIWYGAFENCFGLTGSLIIPNSVTHIYDYAFRGCSGFTDSLSIGNSVTSIGMGAFAGCNGFTGELIIPNSVTIIEGGWSNGAFESCSGFTSLVLGDSLTIIGKGAFKNCSGFTGNLTIPNSVTEIGEFAFGDCSGFTGSLLIPNTVTSIGESAFRRCAGFEAVIIEEDNAVYDSRENSNAIIKTNTNELIFGCKNTIIPNTVITIGRGAFEDCSGLTSIVIPNSVTIIDDFAFYYCTGLTGSFTIPSSVTSIGSYAFVFCSGLTGDLVIPNSVTTIGDAAFASCYGFNGRLTIPNSVTSIGHDAFGAFYSLTEAIIYNQNPPFIGSDAFLYTSFPIYVPYESLNDYKTATNWSSYESRIFPMAYTTVAGYGEGEGNYRFIASPLVENTAPTAVDSMITETPYDLYRFDQSEDAEWINYKANMEDFVLQNGQGYLYANAEDVNLIFKGAFNEDDTKEVGLAYDATATFAGWNLVGNPFPVNAYANKSYYTMNEEGTAIEPNMVSSATAIPACTGVMVMAEAEGETVVFSTEAPEAATNQGCLQIELSQAVELVETPTRKQDGPSTGSGTLLDKAIVSFNAVDRLEKFVFNKENAVISIPEGGKELAIACSNKQGEMPLNFKASKNGEYTLTIHPEAVELDYLHLIDNLTGADVDLLALRQAQGPANYTFEAKTTDYASRFRLVFSGKEADGPSTGSETFAFINNGNIIITGVEAGAKLQIVDMTGRVVASCGGHTRCVPTTGMAKGVYVLRLINGDDVKTQKIVIR